MAFAYFDAVFPVLRYDNLKSAVKKVLRGHQREETARFIIPLALGIPGGVLHSGRKTREGKCRGGNYLVPVPTARNLEESNLLLAAGSREKQNRVIEGRAQFIPAGMVAERVRFLPLAEDGYALASLHFPEINAQMVHAPLSAHDQTPRDEHIECFLDMPRTAKTWLTGLILPPLEAGPTGTRIVAGIPGPVGTVCALAASAIPTRSMVSSAPHVPHLAPIFGGFAVLTPGM